MKRLFGLLVIVSLICLPCYSAVVGQLGGQDSDGNYYWTIDDDGTLIGYTGAEISLGGVERSTFSSVQAIKFDPAGFMLTLPYQGNVAKISTSTAPGLEYDNNLASVVWADGEVTHIQVTFRVPADYTSGGAFRALCDSSATTTAAQIDYGVYVNASNEAWDSSSTDQTAVALSLGASTPEIVTMSITTDFGSLAAGDIVTFEAWRDDTVGGTDDLELYYLEFYYTATK